MNKDYSAQLPNGDFFPFWDDITEYTQVLYVDQKHPEASDSNPGTAEQPFKTINAAAKIAAPRTKVLIKAGEYRETVRPARGGEAEDAMIAYEAAPGEDVVIKASVEVKEFKKMTGWRLAFFSQPPPQGVNVWEIALDPEDFKGYNPFCAVNIIHDRVFIEYAKTDMTTYLNRRGMVFIDGKPLKQVPLVTLLKDTPGSYWVESNGQKVHIRLEDDGDPHGHRVEITNREQCFAPEIPFLSYIRLSGITCAHAATGAPVPQRGSISAYRGHHWIIENCTIDWSNATGIDCGNECWHHPIEEGQVLGYNIIRGNTIRDVGVCGIAAMRSTHMLVEDNLIDRTGWQRMELSWEAGGMKVHNANGMLFRRNIVSNSLGCDSIWLDVNNYNCRVTGNLLINAIDSREHIFMECGKDEETLIDNNIIWGVEGRYKAGDVPAEPGSSGWYKDLQEEVANGYGIYSEGCDRLRIVNNLIGNCNNAGYYAKTVPFRIHGRGGTNRDNKFFNNLFYGCKDAAIKLPNPHNESEGNAFAKLPFRGGYLRVIYPLPTLVLDLPAWREFCGFDHTGCLADIEIEINYETLEMTIDVREQLPAVKADPKVKSDFFTNALESETRPAGPLENLPAGKTVINIDPRKKR